MSVSHVYTTDKFQNAANMQTARDTLLHTHQSVSRLIKII